MLREPQHDRKIINDFKFSPFVLSHVEGLRWVFQQPARLEPRLVQLLKVTSQLAQRADEPMRRPVSSVDRPVHAALL
jgi:hypothetical protein